MLGLAAMFGSVACDGDEIARPKPETITSGFATGGACRDQAYCPDTAADRYESGPRGAVDREAAVRFSLAGRVLTVRLLASAPGKTRRRISGARIRASCGKGFAQLRPDSEVRQTRTRLWPAGRARMRYRFRRDISLIATWCRLEDPKVGHVAFVRIDP